MASLQKFRSLDSFVGSLGLIYFGRQWDTKSDIFSLELDWENSLLFIDRPSLK